MVVVSKKPLTPFHARIEQLLSRRQGDGMYESDKCPDPHEEVSGEKAVASDKVLEEQVS